MCFSASASFGAGAVLTAIGMAAIKEVKSPDQKMFSAIPFLFALQQIAEGFIWLSFSDPIFLMWRQIFTYGFLIFAQIIWPVWVPVSIMLMENDKKALRVLKVLSFVGVLASAYLAYGLFSYPVHAEAASYHIAYYIDLPDKALNDRGLSYLLVTILPPFFASIKKIRMFGFTILLSFLVTKLYFAEYLVSVWCFFAAITSGIVYYIMYDINKRPLPQEIYYATGEGSGKL